MTHRAFLIVRAGGRQVGLRLEHLIEVVEPGTCYPVPSSEPSVRGVMAVRGRLLPVVHLGALLQGGACPSELGEACVVVDAGGRTLCFEVDDAETVAHHDAMPAPPDASLPWAAGVARCEDGLVPLLDVLAVGARLMETGAQHEQR